MKSKFDLKNWMTENRTFVIEKFESLKKEAHYNGITLKDFMIQVFTEMSRQRLTNEKSASQKLPFMVSNVVFENSKIDGICYMIEKYRGTQYSALV